MGGAVRWDPISMNRTLEQDYRVGRDGYHQGTLTEASLGEFQIHPLIAGL
jgi:hypothetical protein